MALSLEIRSPILKELFVNKFVQANFHPNSLANGLPKCDFCDFVLMLLKKKEVELVDKTKALKELKQMYVGKKFEFNQNIIHGQASGCLSYLMSCQESIDLLKTLNSETKEIFMSFLTNDVLPLTNLKLKDMNGNDLLKTAIQSKFPTDFIQSMLDIMENELDATSLHGLLNDKNFEGESCLSLALKNSLDSIVLILTSCSSVSLINIDSEGNSLLHYVHRFKTSAWKKFLYLKDVKNNLGFFPLHIFAQHKVICDDNLFKKVIPARHVINDKNVFGYTILSFLLQDKEWFTCQRVAMLMEAGAEMSKDVIQKQVKENGKPSLEKINLNGILSEGLLPRPEVSHSPFYMEALSRVLDDPSPTAQLNNLNLSNTIKNDKLQQQNVFGRSSTASCPSRPSSFPSIEEDFPTSGYSSSTFADPFGSQENVLEAHHSLLAAAPVYSKNILALDSHSAEMISCRSSSIWSSVTPVSVTPISRPTPVPVSQSRIALDILPKAKSFATVAATKSATANESNTISIPSTDKKSLGVIGGKSSSKMDSEVLKKLSQSPCFTGKVKMAQNTCFLEFRKVLFEGKTKYREIFRKVIRPSVDLATDINCLVSTSPTSKKKVNRLFSDCATKMRSLSGKAVIEMTRVFIAFKVDFNLKGEGDHTNKASLMNVVKICEACSWTPDEMVEIVRLMVIEGGADPYVTDNVANDALKLAVHLKLPTGIVEVLCEKALESNSRDLFTSVNIFRQNIITISASGIDSTREYLLRALKRQALKQDKDEEGDSPKVPSPIGPPSFTLIDSAKIKREKIKFFFD